MIFLRENMLWTEVSGTVFFFKWEVKFIGYSIRAKVCAQDFVALKNKNKLKDLCR